MSDDDLDAIRAKRLSELHAGGASNNDEKKKAVHQEEVMRNSILKQVLEQDAWARLNNLLIAKPDKGKMVEKLIIQMAKTGQIHGKLTDADLKKLLDRIAERTQKTTVKFDRRRAAINSDSEEDE